MFLLINNFDLNTLKLFLIAKLYKSTVPNPFIHNIMNWVISMLAKCIGKKYKP